MLRPSGEKGRAVPPRWTAPFLTPLITAIVFGTASLPRHKFDTGAAGKLSLPWLLMVLTAEMWAKRQRAGVWALKRSGPPPPSRTSAWSLGSGPGRLGQFGVPYTRYRPPLLAPGRS